MQIKWHAHTTFTMSFGKGKKQWTCLLDGVIVLVNAPTKSPSKVDGAEAHHFVGFNSETQNEGKKKQPLVENWY